MHKITEDEEYEVLVMSQDEMNGAIEADNIQELINSFRYTDQTRIPSSLGKTCSL